MSCPSQLPDATNALRHNNSYGVSYINRNPIGNSGVASYVNDVIDPYAASNTTAAALNPHAAAALSHMTGVANGTSLGGGVASSSTANEPPPPPIMMCTASFLPEEQAELDYILKDPSAPNSLQNEVLEAAIVTSKQWPSGSVITIAFESPHGDLNWIPPESIEGSGLGDADDTEYYIREHFRNSTSDAVKYVVENRIAPLCTDLTFEFIDDYHAADIRISFTRDSAWSMMGTDCHSVAPSQPTMNIGWMSARVIMHEFGHALGMIHEHSRLRG